MAAAINFYADEFHVTNLTGSGLGFYGAGFGQSVNVGEYQDTTFITNSNGTVEGAQVNNVKYLNTMSGIIGSAESGVLLTQIPNYLATLNIRFTNDSPVKVQNCKLRIYDRSNINNDPSGVLCRVAELIHPDITQNNNGSGSTEWSNVHGSGSILTVSPSPGMSGLFAGDGTSSVYTDLRHDWFISLSQSPNTVGSKTSALYFSCEYL